MSRESTWFVDTSTVLFKESQMAKVRPPYTAKFREQMLEYVRAGRSPASLSREFGVSAQSITNWIGQAAIESGKLPGKEELTTTEWEQLIELRRKLRQLQTEHDLLLAKAAAWFVGRSDTLSTKSGFTTEMQHSLM